MAGQTRSERVQEALRQEISKIVHDELKDPRLGFITITRVELTKDLRYAKVYFSVLEEDKKSLALKAFRSSKGFVKHLISERIPLRYMPEIDFRLDRSFEHTKRIYDILETLKKEKETRDVDKEGDRGAEETR